MSFYHSSISAAGAAAHELSRVILLFPLNAIAHANIPCGLQTWLDTNFVQTSSTPGDQYCPSAAAMRRNFASIRRRLWFAGNGLQALRFIILQVWLVVRTVVMDCTGIMSTTSYHRIRGLCHSNFADCFLCGHSSLGVSPGQCTRDLLNVGAFIQWYHTFELFYKLRGCITKFLILN